MPAPAASQQIRIDVKAEPLANGLRLSYVLRQAVGAAAFLRNGYVWVILDVPNATFNHRGVTPSPGGRVITMEQVANNVASVARYRVRPGQSLSVQRTGATWQINLKDSVTALVAPVEIGVQPNEAGTDRIFMPVADVGSRVDLVDPAIGDNIVAVPLLGAGRGVPDGRDLVEFRILPTGQGIAVQIKADGVLVNRYRNGVVVDKTGGLTLSKVDQQKPFQTKPEGGIDVVNAAGAAQAEASRPAHMIDFAAWRLGPRDMFTDNLHNLLSKLSKAKGNDRNRARWDLARFYLGFGMGQDALGPLKLMAENDATLLDEPDYRAVRGVALILSGRYEEATEDLNNLSLTNSPDAALWRTIADQELEKWDEALADYDKGSDVLSLYDQTDRARFELAAIKAAYNKANVGFMERELSIVSTYVLLPVQAAEVEYLQGRMHELSGDTASAMTAYKKVADAKQRRMSAQAQLALTVLQLKDSKIKPAEAIDKLERLRFAWRGDQFELDLLDRLGRLYFDNNDYRTGFETLRQAVTYFGKSRKTRDVSQLMSEIFSKLFLEGGADSMPPVSALALYYDFRELTPLGADGDQMIRRLSDRLVAVDLLDRAAELLEHQVKFRMEGVARATVATRLAMIYLMDQKPDKALEIIRSTRQVVMPADIDAQRSRIEARALTDLKRFEEAGVLLENDRSAEADLLRADIYWGSGDWKNVTALGSKLLGKRWEIQKPLTPDERRQVLRMALAMSLSEDRAGIKELRAHYMAAMAGGAYENAFNLITSTQEQNSAQLQAMTRDIAGVDTLEAFMNNYKKEFTTKK